ncbi:hypothetical protein PQR75_00765 [Paraburkholderia fungorum]|uniref:hypothetical protein n=1 Tax=Paraburkholderia fungorum TaxID=134537 RepID=UPI0038B9551F
MVQLERLPFDARLGIDVNRDLGKGVGLQRSGRVFGIGLKDGAQQGKDSLDPAP